MNKLQNKLQHLKLRMVVVKTKYWNKLNAIHKKIVLISIVAIIAILAIAMYISHLEHESIKDSIHNKTNTSVIDNYPFHKPVVVNSAPQNIDHSKDLQHQIEALKSQNDELTQELSAHKDELATKQDIKNLVNYINSNNQTITQTINDNQNSNIELYRALEVKLSSQISKVIAQNPIQLNNTDFDVTSIIWINGKELLMVHDNALDRNVSLTVDETYKGWELLTINNKNCAVFKNNKGVNTQCIH
jgi:hypothetical protein